MNTAGMNTATTNPLKLNTSVPSNGNKPYAPGFGGRDRQHIQKRELRIPFLGFLPNKPRNHFIAMVGEFIGTFLFLFFAFSATQVANAAAAGAGTADTSLSQIPNAGTLLYISLAFGFSLAVNAWVFFRISGGLFNPAVTFGMVLIGAITWIRAILIFIAQILGAIAAAAVVSGLFPGPLNVSTNINGTTSVTRGLFIEMFLTAELVFTIFMLAAEKHKGTFIAPIGIGLALFVAEMSGVYFTGGSLNPARSFGPCVVTGVFPGIHWIYWLGPLLGALLAVGFYHFVKTLEYETANPGQDFNEHEDAAFEFDEDNAARGADVSRPTNHDLQLKPTRSDNQIPMSNVGTASPVPTANSPTHNPNARPIPIQSNDPVHPANPNMRPIRMDGSDSDESSKNGGAPYNYSPNAESGTLHPGFTKF